MGFNLRQKLEETFADINPFDNGATAQTVRTNRVKAQPAQTVKKQQIQNRPMFQQNNQPAFTQQKQFKIQTQSPTINVNNSMPKVQTFGQSSDPLKVGQVKTPQIQLQVQQPTALQITAPTAQVPAQQPNPQAPKVYTPEAQQAYTDAKIIGTGRPNEVKQAITRTVDRKNSVRLDPQFKQGKSYEDIARDAGFSIDEVKRYAERNHKGYGDQGLLGNAARATGQFVGGMVKSGTNIVARPFNDLGDMDRSRGEAELQQINRDYRSGNITPAAAMERANTLAGRYTTRKATLGDDGYIRIGNQTPIEFTGNVAQQGIDSASLLPVAGGAASGSAQIASALGNKTAANTLNKAASVMTAGAQTQATSKLANALTARGINPQTANLIGNAVTSNAKQSLVYGTAQTGADVASGRGITPESLAMNYGADFLMGAVPEIGLGSIGRGIDLNNTKVHQELVRTNPIYKANTDKLTAVDATIARAQANGDIRALEGLQAVKAQLSQSNALIARRYAEQGFLGGKNATGFKDAEARGEVFTDTPDGLPRFEVDDSGAKIKNPNGSTLGEVLDHPQLFKNYPELASMPVDTKNMAELAGGYMPKSKRIALDAPDKGTVLHETQHAIQDIEGADMSYAPSVYKYDDAVKILKSHETVGRELLKMADAKKQIDAMPGKRTVAERKKIAQLDEALQRKIETYKRLDAGQKDAQNTINNYNNSSIEAEARAVQARMDMPMSERYVKPKPLYHGTKKDFKQFGLNAETKQARADIAKLNTERSKLVESGKVVDNALTIPPRARKRIAQIDKEIESIYQRPNIMPSNVKEKGVYLTSDKNYAETFAGKEGKILETQADVKNPYVIESKDEMDLIEDAAYYPDIIKNLESQGYDGIKAPDGQVLVFDPSKVSIGKPQPQSTFYDSLDVPKKDLIVRNGDGKAMSVDPTDPTAALKAEALKYKSADEFVRAQGNAKQVANALKVVEDAKKSGVMTSDVIKAYNTLAKNNVVDMNTIPVEHRQYVAKKTWEDATTRVSNLEQMYNQAHTPQPKPVTQPKPEVAQAKATVSVEPKDPTTISKESSTGDVTMGNDKVYKNTTFKGNGRETLEGEIYSKLAGTDGIASGKVVDTPQGRKIETPFYNQVISVDTLPKDQRWKAKTILENNFNRINKSVSDLTNAGYEYNDPLQFGYKSGKVDLMDFSNAMKADPDTAFNANMAALSRFYSEFGADKYANIIDEVSSTRNAYKATQGAKTGFGDAGIYDKHPELLRQTYVEPNNVYIATNGRDIMLPDITQTTTKDGLKLIFSDKPLSAKDMSDWEMKPIHQTSSVTSKVEAPTPKPTLQDAPAGKSTKIAPKLTADNSRPKTPSLFEQDLQMAGLKATPQAEKLLESKAKKISQSGIAEINKANTRADVLTAYDKAQGVLSEMDISDVSKKALADAQVERLHYLVDNGLEPSRVNPTAKHQAPKITAQEQAARGQAEWERRIKEAGLVETPQGLKPVAKTEAPLSKSPVQPKPKTAFEKSLEDAGVKPKPTKDVKKAIDAKMLNDDEASQKAIGTQGLQNSKSGQRQSQGKRIRPTNQGTSSRSSQQSGQKNPLPDNKARTGRTYPDNTPDIDTAQYVKDMGRSQKSAMQSESGIKAKAADFKEKFIDDLSPIEDRLNKAIKDGASVDVKDHITYQLDRSRRAEGVMNAYVRDNGLDKIIQNVDNVDEFDQYLIARHAKELDPEITTGRDIAKDAALVRQLDGKYGEAAKELYKYNQKLLDTSVDYGLISKESAAALKKQYPDYVPFNRIFNEDELANLYGGAGKGDASLSSQNVVKKIKGSNRAIASPLNSIIDKTRVVVEQGERNRAAQMLANYRELPGNPYNLKEIPKNETIGTRHTISYLDKGVKRTFETDKVIADAAKNMTRQEIGLWGRIAAVPARVLRGGATTVNIGFAGANVVKDVTGAAINSKHPFRIADPKAFGKALSAALEHDGPYYQELMREGIAGTSFDMYRNPLKSNIGEIRSHKNLGTRAAYNVTHPSQWYRTLENTIGRSEDFGRALQYYSNKSGFEAKLGKGSKDAKTLAADQARHNSTNFFRHGSAGKGINLAIPYWNAGVQGARIQTRRIAERPVQTVAKIGFTIAAPSAMIAMNNYSTPERQEIMDNIQDYEKEGNIIILGANPRMNQETGKWEDVYKIPVPPQHIGIHTAVQDAVRSAKTGEEFDVLKNLGKITQNYTTVNPTNLRETASSYTPQALKLVAEPMTNTNFFTGNKIVPESQKNLPAKDQFGDYTSGTAKILGGITNISPRQIDNAIRTGTGGAGQNALWASDKMLAGTGAIEAKDVKGQDPLTSITRRFSGAASVSASDKAENLFKKYKEQVVQTNEYKNASQYDKQRMLNRLQNDLSAVEWDKTGKSEKNLTGKQKALKSDGFDPSVYTNLDSKTANKGTPKEKYDQTLKDYNDNKANMSEVQRFKKEKELATLKVKSNFDKDVVDLWGMSKADIYGLLTKDKDGNRKANELIKLDQAMYDAGLTKYLTFKNGIAPAQRGGTKRASTGRKGAGSRGGRARSAKGKFDYKLFGFSGSTSSNSKQLHDLLKKAQMRV